MQATRNTQNDESVVRPALVHARAIPPLTHREAGGMAKLEFERFLALVTSFSAEDWEKPTPCTLWNVRQVVAHVTGACAASAQGQSSGVRAIRRCNGRTGREVSHSSIV